MVDRPTPLICLRALAPGTGLWAKLESLHVSGSVHDRVAAGVLAQYTGPVLIAGEAGWCSSLLAAAARAPEVRVVAALVRGRPSHEDRALLRAAAALMLPDPGALLADDGEEWMTRARREANLRGAVLVLPDAAAHYRDTLGVELAADLGALPSGPPPLVFAPADAHGLIDGLRAAGLAVRPVGAAAGARALDGLEVTDDGVTDADAAAMRADAARREGLLIAHSAAAVLHAARAWPDGRRVAILAAAGDRAFSRDAEAAA